MSNLYIARSETLFPVPETRIGDLTMLYPSYQKPSRWQIFEHTIPACKYGQFETIPYSCPTLIEYLRTALTACTLSTNLMPNWMSVTESFQSSNRTVPDSTRSSIGEPEPISKNAPECV
ncbi:hypothetical protein M9H77_15734 [Catharanthus roseus]|uniref:Uncharacterized protein n=1 Tax=Catharanthus roseus TaxID=4058 RepID=A0ACC0B126_CATRO|nr:hypothetical protein M9H77_15734 [Catharanthus roseus]